MQKAKFYFSQSTTDCEKTTCTQKKGQNPFFTIRKKGNSFLWGIVPFYIFVLPLVSHALPNAPTSTQLWREIALPSRAEDSLLNVLVERHRYLPFVKRAVLLEVNATLLHRDKVSITIGGHSATIKTLLGENANVGSFIRYGELSDDRSEKNDPSAPIGDIFFAVQNDLIASKFYFEEEIYALIPLYKHYHLLLQLNPMRLPNECGTVHRFGATPEEAPASADYQLRVLVAFSQIAISGLKHYSLSMTPEHFAQMAIGENNLAHWRNPKRTPHLNLEKVSVLSYSELEMKRDLANLTAERPPFDLLQRWRTDAATDLQILIRSSEDALFGMAQAEADGWSSGRAFCVMTLDGFGFTPYSLAHQIEHLRPEAKEPTYNTIAPSVFQTRLNHKNQTTGLSEAETQRNPVNAYKIRFFARHSIFYGDTPLWNAESIDTQLIKGTADQLALLEYWDILPFNWGDNDFLRHPWVEEKNEKGFLAPQSESNVHRETAVKTEKKIQFRPQTVEIVESDHAPQEDDTFFAKKLELPPFRIMPNPTHGETFLEYQVPKDGLAIRLDLVTLTGQFVARLAENGNHPAGRFTVRWDASGMPAGVYVCTLRMGDKVQVLRLVVE